MDVGAELARARRAQGLSLDTLAKRTKVSVENLSAIEANRIEELPPAVYVRGFLRSLAAELDLDPDEVTARYLAQFELVSPDPSGALSDFESETDDMRPDEPAEPIADDFALAPPTSVPVAADPRATRHTAGPGYGVLLAVMLAAAAGGFMIAEYLRPKLSALSSAAAAVRRPAPSPIPTPKDADRASEAAPGSSAEAKRDRPEPASSVTGSAAPSEPAHAGNPPPPSASAATPPSAADRSAAAATTPSPAETRLPPATRSDARRDLSGWWTVANRVESSSYRPFQGLALGYRLKLTHQGNRVTGTGQKWTEKGRVLPRARRTPIEVNGTVEGRRVVLSFTEQGARRRSAGVFTYNIADNGSLEGTFASDAAQSRGSSRARRMAAPR